MNNTEVSHTVSTPSFADAIWQWARIGLLSFGGPAAQIALMHRIVVDEKRWLSEKQYLNALSFCMLLPGPEAMQLATYTGWRLHGVRGGLAAGLLFVLPGAVVVLALALIYAVYGNVPLLEALFYGVKAAVLVIVVEAFLRISKRALTGLVHRLITCLAFIGIFFFHLPFPVIIGLSALAGFLLLPDTQAATTDQSSSNINKAASYNFSSASNFRNAIKTISLWLFLWFTPILVLVVTADNALLSDIGIFFSKLAVVTFGGAYAVLAYLAQDVVTQFGWLTAGEMMDGLALAETTPGPLILVTEFVGFLAGYRDAGVLMGFAAALLTLWVTFVPCFLWIFAGAPYIEWVGQQRRLRNALAAITAAVVGVILNLSLWFALHVFFHNVQLKSRGILHFWQTEWSTLDWRIVLLTIICATLAFARHWGIGTILLTAAILGAALYKLPF